MASKSFCPLPHARVLGPLRLLGAAVLVLGLATGVQAQDGSAPDEGATAGDWGEEGTDAPPAPIDDVYEAPGPGATGPGTAEPGAIETDPGTDPAVEGEADPYGRADADSDDGRVRKPLSPVEGLDPIPAAGTAFGAAAALNLGVGGALIVGGLGGTLLGVTAVSTVCSGLSCLWGCLAAPVLTGVLVAYVQEAFGKTRGNLLFPVLASVGSAVLLGATIGLGAAVAGAFIAGYQNNIAVGSQPTPQQSIIMEAIGGLGAGMVGIGMSAAAVATYAILAEPRRPGDNGEGFPGFVEPAHQVPLNMGQTAQVAAPPSVAMAY